MKTKKCIREVVWHGQASVIEVSDHSFAWSGRMPCTGVVKCIYCGLLEEDVLKHSPVAQSVERVAVNH